MKPLVRENAEQRHTYVVLKVIQLAADSLSNTG